MGAGAAAHLAGVIASQTLLPVIVTSAQRSSSLPDVPTAAEAGYSNLELQLWVGVFAPAKTPPAVLAKAQSLLTTWTGIYEAASTAKGAQKTTSLSRKELRTVLEAELFKNLLMLAILFPNDEVKAAQYCPKHLLETRASSVTPGAATLTLVNFNVETRQADMSIAGDGAETYRVLCKPPGEADFIVWAEDIEPVDGVATYSIGLNLAGTYEFVAEGVNGSRVGERSAVVSVG